MRYAGVLRRAFASESGSGLTKLAGIPEKHAARSVRIYRPAKVATQQGRSSMTEMWRIQFEKEKGDDRWTNPLMGWTSTGDPLSNASLNFLTKEAAIEYAQRNGFEFTVIEPEEEVPKSRNISAYKRAMVHHWNHSSVPVYEGDEEKK